nr:hypothetical protein [Serratia marcescens]
LRLNEDMQHAADRFLTAALEEELAAHENTENVADVRRLLERFFRIVAHDYRKERVSVNASEYIQAFADEYSFLSTQLAAGKVKSAVANELYTEINQAQTLLLMEQGSETES